MRTTGIKAKTRKRPAGPRKEARKMAKKPDTPVPIEPEDQPTYEPPVEEDHVESSENVVVDVEQARIPRSENAQLVAEQAKGMEQVEMIRRRGAGSGGVFDLNPYDLWLEPGWNVRNFNTRQRKANLSELSRSITAIGVREALLAYIKDDKIVIYQGWNRLLATYHAIEQGAPVKAIPVRFGRSGESDADRTLSQLVNNGVRSDLTPFEKGIGIKRMVNFGWQLPEIANSMGKSVTNVKGLLDLQALPMSLQALVADGTVSAYYATKAYRDADENEEKALHELHTAIANAKEQGAKRVMPKHGEDAPPRRARAGGGGRGVGGGRRRRREITTTTNDIIPQLVEIIRRARFEKVVEENTVLMSFTVDDFNTLAVLAELPEDYETGLEPSEPDDADEVAE